METSQNPNANTNSNPNTISSSIPMLWPTIDGYLCFSEEELVSYARRLYKF
uniref:Uncharacterized protein n=1 Tax=Cucumis sativus TaxID=3659 RepID=A0A0A0LMS0_CUCSA